jgi:hypothetical protein
MKSNVVATMEAPFHVNPLTWLWGIHSRNFQVGKDNNSASVGVNGRWTHNFHIISWSQNWGISSINTCTQLLGCIPKLFSLWTPSHMTHVLMIGSSKNLSEVWIEL